MASSNNEEVISKASPHTIKKFELIESYIASWAQKLMNNISCNGIVFIDCMCNSGVYHDENEKIVYGTPVRVAKVLRDIAGQYPLKQVYLYFNDFSEEKIAILKRNLPIEKDNYHYNITVGDGNVLLKRIGAKLNYESHLHFFLLYDPYDASIDWEALAPFFRHWGEVMINHMVSDPVRAITQVKKNDKKKKYEATYLTDFEKLVPYGSDKVAYQKRVEKIITELKGKRQYYVAAFPFYNTHNSQMYNLIHCTNNIKGYQLYKSTAWKTFDNHSSTKIVKENGQLELDILSGTVKQHTDENCYNINDIVYYVQKKFEGQQEVCLDEIWAALDLHPIFPTEGFKKIIKVGLKDICGAVEGRKKDPMTGEYKNVLSFKKGF